MQILVSGVCQVPCVSVAMFRCSGALSHFNQARIVAAAGVTGHFPSKVDFTVSALHRSLREKVSDRDTVSNLRTSHPQILLTDRVQEGTRFAYKEQIPSLEITAGGSFEPKAPRGWKTRTRRSSSISKSLKLVVEHRLSPNAEEGTLEASAAAAGGQAIMDEVVPAIIVGVGRVGAALENMGGGKDFIVRRGEPIPADKPGPIIVCTRNDALAGIVDATPADRREDLVFIQNGILDPFLESKGLACATQVLVYFAVAKFGDAPIDGITDLNPEGLTAASGKWASAIAARLKSAGLSCKVLDGEEFQKPQLEKLIWICAFMLVGARRPGATVGDVESRYRDELASLVHELAAAAQSEKKIKFDSGVVERLCAYARSVAHFPTAVKEFEWRNGFFYCISQRAVASGESDPCPLHTAWLKEVGAI